MRQLENLPQLIHFDDKIVARIAVLTCAFEISDADGKGDRQLEDQMMVGSC